MRPVRGSYSCRAISSLWVVVLQQVGIRIDRAALTRDFS